MDTAQEHADKALHNLQFLESISTGEFADWAIVALFYRALHVTSVVIHVRGDDHGTSHSARQKAVDRHFTHDNAVGYEQLYSRSRLVRYDQVSAEDVDYNRLLMNSFVPILQEAQRVVPGVS